MERTGRIGRGDVLAGAVLVAVALVYGWGFFDFARVPAEDAAMLMRYALHLGEGHGIVWNVGGAPVDGATDFLFMVAVAGVHALGLSVEAAVQGLCLVAHLVTVVVVFWGARRYYGAPLWAAAVSGAFVALGPGMLYTEAYFGTAFFALFVALAWVSALGVMEEPSGRRALVFSLVALLMGLVRPEGVLVASFMVLAVIFRVGWKPAGRVVVWFVVVFGLVGGGYLLWRLSYFGHVLPNPFYAKQGGTFYPWALSIAVGDVWQLTFPFNVALLCGLLAFLAGLVLAPKRFQSRSVVLLLGVLLMVAAIAGLFRSSDADAHGTVLLGRYSPHYAQLLLRVFLLGVLAFVAAPAVESVFARMGSRVPLDPGALHYLEGCGRAAVCVLIPVLGFTVMWSIIEDHTNYLMRFRYPIVPVVAMAWPLVLHRRWGRFRGTAAIVAAAVAVSIVLLNARLLPERYHRDGRYDVAEMLRGYASQGYRMATTEAGLLPFYSTWSALDLFGLNDPHIAMAGAVDAPYLDAFAPDVVVVAAPFPIELVPPEEPTHMRRHIVSTVHEWAAARGYVLVAAYGATPDKVHYYYVRGNLSDGPALIARIRAMDYRWYLTGERATDFARGL